MKHLKNLYNENSKILLKDIEEDTKKKGKYPMFLDWEKSSINEKLMKQRAGSLKRQNKTDKFLSRLTKEKREMTRIKLKMKKITINTTEIQNVIREYYEKLCAAKLDNPDEMDKFLENITFLDSNTKT